jgi:hypothetical protein
MIRPRTDCSQRTATAMAKVIAAREPSSVDGISSFRNDAFAVHGSRAPRGVRRKRMRRASW